jgi:hypothetical protein
MKIKTLIFQKTTPVTITLLFIYFVTKDAIKRQKVLERTNLPTFPT